MENEWKGTSKCPLSDFFLPVVLLWVMFYNLFTGDPSDDNSGQSPNGWSLNQSHPGPCWHRDSVASLGLSLLIHTVGLLMVNRVCVQMCKNLFLGAGGVAQWVETSPRTTQAKGVLARGSGVQGQANLPSELRASQGYPSVF